MWGGGGAGPPLSFQGVRVTQLPAFVSSPGVLYTLLSGAFRASVILFGGFVLSVHHWNVSPEASMREISNPGHQTQLPEKSGQVGTKRNVLLDLWLFGPWEPCTLAGTLGDGPHHTHTPTYTHTSPQACLPLRAHARAHAHIATHSTHSRVHASWQL